MLHRRNLYHHKQRVRGQATAAGLSSGAAPALGGLPSDLFASLGSLGEGMYGGRNVLRGQASTGHTLICAASARPRIAHVCTSMAYLPKATCHGACIYTETPRQPPATHAICCSNWRLPGTRQPGWTQVLRGPSSPQLPRLIPCPAPCTCSAWWLLSSHHCSAATSSEPAARMQSSSSM